MSPLHALCVWPVSLAFTLSVSIRRYGCFSIQMAFEQAYLP